jgi:hypothetical protein
MKRISEQFRGAALVAASLVVFTLPGLAQYSTPVHDVENPDKSPVYAATSFLIQANNSGGSNNIYTVPAGKRLVIDFVSGFTRFSGGDPIGILEVIDPNTLFVLTKHAVAVQVSANGAVFSQPVRFTAEAGQQIGYGTISNNSGSAILWVVQFTGHLVNVP